MGPRTKSIKTRKKLSIFSKELTFVVVKTTFVFEKGEKEEEILQKKKKMKSTTKSEAQAFFLPHSFLHLKSIQPTDLEGNGKKTCTLTPSSSHLNICSLNSTTVLFQQPTFFSSKPHPSLEHGRFGLENFDQNEKEGYQYALYPTKKKICQRPLSRSKKAIYLFLRPKSPLLIHI